MRNKKLWFSAPLAVLLASASTTPVRAQDQPPAPAKPVVTPIKVTVTISRYQGEKRISALPYVLSINVAPGAPDKANLRMGTRVPVNTAFPATAGAGPNFTYQDVGTNIDCNASMADEGRFRLQISIEESSVYEDPPSKGGTPIAAPSFRSFKTNDSLMLKDGQTAQMSNTPDRMSGETVRVDVALAVVK